MATIDAVSSDAAITSDLSIGKRKRPTEDNGIETRHVNGTTSHTASPEQVQESFQNLLQDLVQVLQEFDVSSTVLNLEIPSPSNKDRTPKRVKLASSTKPTSILSLIAKKAYTNVDAFCEDVRTAVRLLQELDESPENQDAIANLETEVISILQHEITHSTIPMPRSEHGGTLLLTSQKDDGALDTDPNIVLTTPGFVYGSSQASKRLYSSFRLSSSTDKRALQSIPLQDLPNNITATSTKVEKVEDNGENGRLLKDLFHQSKSARLDPPRHSSSSAKGSAITWSKQEGHRKPHRSKDRQSYYDQHLATGQWLSYNFPPSISEMPYAEARRKRRDRALSTGEANVDLTEQEKETIRKSQLSYQQAKADSLFKSLYSSFAPSHDNSGAVVPKDLKSRHWWIKHGAAKYLSESTATADIPFDKETKLEDGEMELDASEVKEDQFDHVLESWIDPSLLNDLPKERTTMDKETEEILSEISDMLQTLSSYQRNRSLALNHKQQGSSTQNKALVELLGDTSTPSESEWLLFDTLKESLTSLITALPPYAVAKLDGEQLGQLNLSTKLLVQNPTIRGTTIDLETQLRLQEAAARPQPNVSARVHTPQQVSTPTTNQPQTLARPPTSFHSKYRVAPGMPGQQNYGHQQSAQPRVSYAPQTPTATHMPLTNGTRPIVNGHPSYRSPQRPGSAPRPPLTTPQQNHHIYSANATNPAIARSISPPTNPNLMSAQAQRTNWGPSTGGTGSTFMHGEVSQMEEMQRARMAVQAAQIRHDSSTPRPAMSPISNGTPGE